MWWQRETRKWAQRFDFLHRDEKGKKKKENGRFHESAYIHRLTDEYRRGRTRQPCTPYVHR
jgi:hypothetical protein